MNWLNMKAMLLLRRCVVGLIVVLTAASAVGAPAKERGTSAYKGEFILSRNEFHNPICQTFTRNLNQFRRVDFNECHPRLSEKFPEFSRPTWEVIPFSLEIAEQVVKGTHGRRDKSPAQEAIAEQHWRSWREQSEAIRKAGQARMWRTRIDLDGDGHDETIIRMVPDTGLHPVRLATTPPWTCDHSLGVLHMTGNIHADVEEAFNTSGSEGADIIYYDRDKRYYRVAWTSVGPAYLQIDIGATAGVRLSRIDSIGSHVERGNECLIDWVPTSKYKPLKRKR